MIYLKHILPHEVKKFNDTTGCAHKTQNLSSYMEYELCNHTYVHITIDFTARDRFLYLYLIKYNYKTKFKTSKLYVLNIYLVEIRIKIKLI